METVNALERKSTLIDELNQGRELANQLKNHINPVASSKQTCEKLVQNILCSYDNALAFLNLRAILQEDTSPILDLEGSPKDAFRPKNQSHKDLVKKRKAFPRWSEQVRVSMETGAENTPDDGHSWRKYGQKDILGATYPRAYYRCTHRHTRGCAATKQVQRSDEDPSILEVTYRGNHSCNHALNSTSTQATLENAEKVKVNKDCLLQHVQEKQKRRLKVETDMFKKQKQSTKVETDIFDSMEGIFPLFSFPSTPIEPESLGSQIFWTPREENAFLAPFVSSTTPESNYCSVSPRQMEEDYDRGHKWQGSTPTSVLDSPFDLDFSIDDWNSGRGFPHDSYEYFC